MSTKFVKIIDKDGKTFVVKKDSISLIHESTIYFEQTEGKRIYCGQKNGEPETWTKISGPKNLEEVKSKLLEE